VAAGWPPRPAHLGCGVEAGAFPCFEADVKQGSGLADIGFGCCIAGYRTGNRLGGGVGRGIDDAVFADRQVGAADQTGVDDGADRALVQRLCGRVPGDRAVQTHRHGRVENADLRLVGRCGIDIAVDRGGDIGGGVGLSGRANLAGFGKDGSVEAERKIGLINRHIGTICSCHSDGLQENSPGAIGALVQVDQLLIAQLASMPKRGRFSSTAVFLP